MVIFKSQDDLDSQIQKKARALWSLFSTKYKVGGMPVVEMHLLSLDCLGLADKEEVTLNTFYVVGEPKLIDPILTHELAHVIQTRMYGYECEDHGPEFREILESFGFGHLAKATIGSEVLNYASS